jgi:hypothetical protein
MERDSSKAISGVPLLKNKREMKGCQFGCFFRFFFGSYLFFVLLFLFNGLGVKIGTI